MFVVFGVETFVNKCSNLDMRATVV